jgi:diketogulonate reductase-like aldo/keto reductase
MRSQIGVQNPLSGHRATRAQIALAWAVRQDGVVAIPRAG